MARVPFPARAAPATDTGAKVVVQLPVGDAFANIFVGLEVLVVHVVLAASLALFPRVPRLTISQRPKLTHRHMPMRFNVAVQVFEDKNVAHGASSNVIPQAR